MEVMQNIRPGLTREITLDVQEHNTAAHVGSGSLRVLATPSMIGFMERCAMELLAQHLPDGYTSVGTWVDVRHLAPTPVGTQVRLQCEILEVEGWKVLFSVQAWDEQEKIGEGRHQRVVIDQQRFLKRVQAKQA
ncbi:MAG: thioesterase family protein [Anaerolineales bacterium]|nr:thioesterase family protein [Anaerolineales bacterium]